MAVAFNQVGSISGVVGGANIVNVPTTLAVRSRRPALRDAAGRHDQRLYRRRAGRRVRRDGGAGRQPHQEHPEPQRRRHELLTGRRRRGRLTGLLVTGTAANPVIYVTSSDPRISNDARHQPRHQLRRPVQADLERLRLEYRRPDPRSATLRGEPFAERHGALRRRQDALPDARRKHQQRRAVELLLQHVRIRACRHRSSRSTFRRSMRCRSRPTPAPASTTAANTSTTCRPSTTRTPPNNGVRENAGGMDVAGPWGGRDGLNQAILPADAPFSIFATGFRNAYDLVLTADGRLYTLDNGSNAGLGGDPVIVNGEATNQISTGGAASGEPLYLLRGRRLLRPPEPDPRQPEPVLDRLQRCRQRRHHARGQHGRRHFGPRPGRGEHRRRLPDRSEQVHLQSGAADRGGHPHRPPGPGSDALVTIGSSSNGLVEYTADNFDGELFGDLLVAQFNGNVARLNLNADGTTATYETIPGLSGLSIPLDVTVGPDGTLWVAEITGNRSASSRRPTSSCRATPTPTTTASSTRSTRSSATPRTAARPSSCRTRASSGTSTPTSTATVLVPAAMAAASPA